MTLYYSKAPSPAALKLVSQLISKPPHMGLALDLVGKYRKDYVPTT